MRAGLVQEKICSPLKQWREAFKICQVIAQNSSQYWHICVPLIWNLSLNESAPSIDLNLASFLFDWNYPPAPDHSKSFKTDFEFRADFFTYLTGIVWMQLIILNSNISNWFFKKGEHIYCIIRKDFFQRVSTFFHLNFALLIWLHCIWSQSAPNHSKVWKEFKKERNIDLFFEKYVENISKRKVQLVVMSVISLLPVGNAGLYIELVSYLLILCELCTSWIKWCACVTQPEPFDI